MKLFGRSGGYWLFWVSAIYLALGTYFIYNKNVPDYSSAFYVLALGLPFIFPPLGRWLNMDVRWDMSFLSFLGWQKMAEDASKVVDFPKPKVVPPVPEVQPSKEEPAKIFYRFGVTDNNRLAFQMGYSELTMNKQGIQNLIDQLTFFQSQLYDEDDNTPPDPGGGEPIPVPEQKAA